MVFLTLLFNVGYNSCAVGSNIWLAKWSSDEDNGPGNMTLSTLVSHCVQCMFKLTPGLHIYNSTQKLLCLVCPFNSNGSN